MRAILFFLLTAGVAQAQTTVAGPSLDSFAAPPTAESDLQVTPPSSAGSPHACGTEWYPPAALGAGEEGTTRLLFRIGVDGTPKAVTVIGGSGFVDLDDAAAKCVATWKYNPARKEGRALEVDWTAAVEWLMPAPQEQTVVVTRGSQPAPPMPSQQLIGSQVCRNPAAPPAPLQKTTLVMFRVERDGSVDRVKLARSSGDDALDTLAVNCVSARHYTPFPDGAPKGLVVRVEPIPW